MNWESNEFTSKNKKKVKKKTLKLIIKWKAKNK